MAVTASQLLADPERHLPSIKLLLELARDKDVQVRHEDSVRCSWDKKSN